MGFRIDFPKIHDNVDVVWVANEMKPCDVKNLSSTSLNDTYIAMRGQILLMDPIPSLSKLFSLLVQDEKQRKVSKTPTIEASASAVKNNGFFVKWSNKGKFGRPQCTHCGALGHVVDKCYKLHGYPPSYKFKNKGQQGGHSSLSFENSVQSCNSAFVIDSTSLWHSRLGHPSFQRLAILQNLVPDVINCSNNKSFDCPICPISKQKRLPFQSSVHVSNSCFDLINVDI